MELMFTLAVFGVLVGIGVPSFVTIVQNSRTATQTNELVSALNLARSEAIRRGAPVTVQETQNGAGFQGGWCVHVGTSCADANNVLRIYPAMTAMNVTTSPALVVFDARGARQLPTTGSVTMTLSPDNCAAGAAGRARRLDIALTGRINLERVSC